MTTAMHRLNGEENMETTAPPDTAEPIYTALRAEFDHAAPRWAAHKPVALALAIAVNAVVWTVGLWTIAARLAS